MENKKTMKYRIKVTETESGALWYKPQRKMKFNIFNPFSWFWITIGRGSMNYPDLGFGRKQTALDKLAEYQFLLADKEREMKNTKPRFYFSFYPKSYDSNQSLAANKEQVEKELDIFTRKNF